jgi:hypothetical protein
MLDAGWPSATALVQLKKCLILHRSKTTKMLPAKGAMAFPAACLYWCRWQGFSGCDVARPQ